MVDPTFFGERLLIGQLYSAAEEKANNSDHGIDDPDAQALFHAYYLQIDMGKHGGDIKLPDHFKP